MTATAPAHLPVEDAQQYELLTAALGPAGATMTEQEQAVVTWLAGWHIAEPLAALIRKARLVQPALGEQVVAWAETYLTRHDQGELQAWQRDQLRGLFDLGPES